MALVCWCFVSVAVGAAVGAGIVWIQGGPSYRASFRIRAATADPLCDVFRCPQTPRNPHLDPYVAGQAVLMRLPLFAHQVGPRLVNAPSTSTMTGHAEIEEVGGSASLAVGYTAASPSDAVAIARAFGASYLAAARARAIGPETSIRWARGHWASLKPRERGGAEGQATVSLIQRLQNAEAALRYGYGSTTARGYANDGLSIQVVQKPPDYVRAGLLGALAGAIFFAGSTLIVRAARRRRDLRWAPTTSI
jgi:hypothetical protein